MQPDEQRSSRQAGNLYVIAVEPERRRFAVPDELVPELLVRRLDSEEPAVQLDADVVPRPVPPLVVTLALDSRLVGDEWLEAEPGGDRLRAGKLHRRDEQVDVPVVPVLTFRVEPAPDHRALQQDAADADCFEGGDQLDRRHVGSEPVRSFGFAPRWGRIIQRTTPRLEDRLRAAGRYRRGRRTGW